MSHYPEPVYELILDIDREVIDSFDDWLASFVEASLQQPGLTDAKVLSSETDHDGRARRVVHFQLDSRQALTDYQSGQEARMLADAVTRFGSRFEVNRAVLHPATSGAAEMPACLNCGTILRGQYCLECGQRAGTRLISLWELTRDAFGDLFELDSRIWRTLIPLALQPGKLTEEYLRGRRARFMPPFRTYLVLSLLFFVIAFFDPEQEFGILFEPPSAESTQDTEAVPADSADSEQETRGATIQCDIDGSEMDGAPPWLARRLTRERLTRVGDAIGLDGAQSFTEYLVDNIPVGLYLLLPFIALVLKVLYPLSRRYYVEHLLFVLHFHAFVFLALCIQLVLAPARAFLPDTASVLLGLVIPLYIPLYLYKGIRRVYRQGHLATILKYMLLLIAYALSFSLMLAITALVFVFSV